MIVPGVPFHAGGAIQIDLAADPTPAYFHGGFGFAANGKLSCASGAPTGNHYNRGFRLSPKGALYVINAADVAVIYEGYAFNASGQLNYQSVAPGLYVNGDGRTSAAVSRTAMTTV